MGTDFQPLERPAPILGVVRNVSSERIDPRAWLTLDNIVIRDGELRKCGGWVRHPATVDGGVNLVKWIRFPNGRDATAIGTPNWLYNHDGAQQTVAKLNTTRFNGNVLEKWSVDYLLSRWYFSSVLDGVWWWDGSRFDQLDTGSLRGRHVAQFENHLILASLASVNSDGPRSLVGSGLANPDDWDTANPASEAVLMEYPGIGNIQALRRLGEWLALYAEEGIGLLEYVGPDPIYQRRPRVDGGGVLAPASLVQLGPEHSGVHAYVSHTNVCTYAGGSRPEPIGDRIWKYWLSVMAKPGRPHIYGFRDHRHKEVIFAYQGLGQDGFSHALVWNYEFDAWSFRDWPFSAVGFVRKVGEQSGGALVNPAFDQIDTPMDEMTQAFEDVVTVADFDLLAGDADGALYRLDDETETADGTASEAVLESGDDACGDRRRHKVESGMLVDVPTLTGSALQVYICARDSLKDPIVWQGPFTYDGTSDRVDYFVSGVWIRRKFVKPDGQLSLRGYTPLVKIRGEV